MQILLRNKINFLLCVVFTCISCIAVVAEEFSISNNQLIISGEDVEDAEKILSLLENNEKIDTVVFDVWGGSQSDAIDIADIIIDFELDTHISGSCWGNCVFMFVAGEKRTMARGSEVSIRFYPYTKEQIDRVLDEKTYEYIGSLAEYIIWIDETARAELVEYFSLLVERGIKPEFIIKSIEKGTIERWIPRRKELLEANFLTE